MLKKNKYFFPVLIILLIITLICAIAFGSVSLSLNDMGNGFKKLFTGEESTIRENVFIQLRLPRVLLCGITGAVLAVSGVLMQGLFRNPIVEPGLVGTSAGASFGAAFIFVVAPKISPAFKSVTGPLLVPLFAFLGSLLATFAVYALAKNSKRVSILSLLLVGLAINAVAISGTSFMSYIARDPQARSIAFWNMGIFSGASWLQVAIVGGVAALVFIFTFFVSKQLNALLLGEEEAGYLGVDVNKLKTRVLILNTAMVSVATAFVGTIAFMGLIIPHILRLLIGSDNKRLLPASMIAGAILMNWADVGSRLIVAPAEMPVGIITSLVGAPIFIILLKKFNVLQKGGYHA